MTRLSARLVTESDWEATNGRPQAIRPTREPAGTQVVVLQFLLDGSPLDRSRLWTQGPELIAPGIAVCLQSLRRSDEALVLRVSSAPRHERQALGRRVRLRSEDLVYYDYIVSGLIETFAWLNAGDEASRESELVFEVADELLPAVVQLCFDWNSFRGFVVSRSDLAVVREWPFEFRHDDWEERRRKQLQIATVLFEDWADGCALRLWGHAAADELPDRIRLDEVNAVLADIQIE
jgi:hypothetical protein